jgi:hypothetical protein
VAAFSFLLGMQVPAATSLLGRHGREVSGQSFIILGAFAT